MNKKLVIIGTIALAVVVMIAGAARAAVPGYFYFQGVIKPAPNTVTNVEYSPDNSNWTAAQGRTYDAATGFLSATFEVADPVTFAATNIWIRVNGSIAFGPQLLASTPYAFRAGALDGLTIKAGKVGIGISEPVQALDVDGKIQLSTNGTKILISGDQSSSSLYLGGGGQVASSGGNNTALGIAALQQLTTGAQNTAIGTAALIGVTTGTRNTAIGHLALVNLQSGGDNVAIGDMAGKGYGNLNLNINRNTFIGYEAGGSVRSGANDNVLIGCQAGEGLTTGSNNIMIGYDVDPPAGIASNYLNIGNLLFGDLSSSRLGIGTTDPNDLTAKLVVINKTDGGNANVKIWNRDPDGSGDSFLTIWRTSSYDRALVELGDMTMNPWFVGLPSYGGLVSTDFVIAQDDYVRTSGGTERAPELYISSGSVKRMGIGTRAPQHDLDVRGTVASNGTRVNSDERWKKDIAAIPGALSKVCRLRGVAFNWRAEEFKDCGFDDARHIGLIAQEVEPVVPEAVSTGGDGFKSVGYANLTALLIESVKELKAENDWLRERIAEAEAKLAPAGGAHGEEK